MVELESLLFRLAREAAQAEQQRAEELAKEIVQLEGRPRAEAEAELRLALTATDRLDGFKPEMGGHYQCPVCWVTGHVRANLISVDSDTGADVFRCLVCRRDVSAHA